MERSSLAICLMFIVVAASTLYEAQGHFLLKHYLEKFPSKSSEFKPFAFKGMIGFVDNLEGLCPVKEEYKEFFKELKGFMSFINSASGSSSEFNSKLKAQSEGLFKAISTLSGKAGSSGDTSKLIESLTSMGKTLAGYKRTGSQTITSDQRKKLMKSMVKWAKGIGKFVKKVGKKSGDAKIDLSVLGIGRPSESETPSSDTGSPSAETGGPATSDSPADDSETPNSSGDSSMDGGTSDAAGPSEGPADSSTASGESSMGGGSSPDTQDASGDGGSPSGSPTESSGSGENSTENETAGGETSSAGGPSGSTSDMSTEGTSSIDGGTSGGSTDNSAAGESSMNGGGSYSDTTGGSPVGSPSSSTSGSSESSEASGTSSCSPSSEETTTGNANS